ncbi:hypothetical protein C2G38_2206108 [Gigaspora rosea]|uniref:F-box domain-containing protein n=1 Tax=Gigaspora rosea TaxID=44941 RepID=A0A397UJP2_9GLOM|nr:hypothetical protein C2G38_2206108 [Gigaspora rosea]
MNAFMKYNYLKFHFRSLFLCLLVNRQWCRNVIPILWCEPLCYCDDKNLMRIYLLSLNTEEKASLVVPLNILLPNGRKLLFKYTSFATVISDYDLEEGIINWLCEGNESIDFDEFYDKIFRIRKHDSNTKTLLKTVHKTTTITSLDLFQIEFDFEEIRSLADVLCKNTSLTSLKLYNCELDSEETKILLKAFYENKTLSYLDLSYDNIGDEGIKAFSDVLYKISL